MNSLEPSPRAVDWGILAAVVGAGATGLLAWTGWDVPVALLVDVHAVLGFALLGLLAFKFRRVAGRVTDSARWDRTTPISVALAAVVLGGVGTGVAWSLGLTVWVGPWTLLAVHIGLGLLVVPLVGVHLGGRF